MKRRAIGVIAGLVLLTLAAPAVATPDLRKGRLVGVLTVFPDDNQPGRFYYPPGDLTIAQDAAGKPHLHFLHVRYTGSGAMGDRGLAVFRSVLTLRVVLAGPTLADVKSVRDALVRANPRLSIELRPLSIRRLEAALVYAPVTAAAATPAKELPAGHFEGEAEAEGKAAPAQGEYWRERTFTIGMASDAAQLFSGALEQGQLALSVGYAFYADGVAPTEPIAELKGTPELLAALRARLEAQGRPAGDPARAPQLVRAGAIAVTADTKKWPELVRRLDVNETAPPGYAALDIYCYDFNNDLRPDLYEKDVAIEAQGVGGAPVRLLAVFRRDQPDLVARTLRFPVAVRLDRPYRYRLIEIALDGRSTQTTWRVHESWAQILDVTSKD
jgi:hypothetical protein